MRLFQPAKIGFRWFVARDATPSNPCRGVCGDHRTKTRSRQIRDALNLAPGCSVDFAVNREGDVVIHKVGAKPSRKPDRFESARGRSDVKWRTDDLMALLRGAG